MKKAPAKFSVKSRLLSFRFAINGLISLLREEHNSRIQLIAAILAVILGFLLKINLTEWLALIMIIGLVFITELINSAIESLSDVLDPKWNDLIGKAKDYSAAAVLISAIVGLIAGCLIFIPKFF